jgi:DNA-binding transcriptional ArsR family regulator
MMDTVFRALADPSRRQLLDSLNARNGQTLSELCGQLEIARQSVSVARAKPGASARGRRRPRMTDQTNGTRRLSRHRPTGC